MRCAEPEAACRTTTRSTFMASIVRTVSFKLSPFWVLDPDEEKFTMSALKRLAASSKEIRVRVEASKNMLATVFPRRAGTFLTSRAETSLKDFAVSKISPISSRVSSSKDKRWGLVQSDRSARPPRRQTGGAHLLSLRGLVTSLPFAAGRAARPHGEPCGGTPSASSHAPSTDWSAHAASSRSRSRRGRCR